MRKGRVVSAAAGGLMLAAVSGGCSAILGIEDLPPATDGGSGGPGGDDAEVGGPATTDGTVDSPPAQHSDGGPDGPVDHSVAPGDSSDHSLAPGDSSDARTSTVDSAVDSGVDSGAVGATCSTGMTRMATYPGTVQAGALALTADRQTFIGNGGYAYAYSDPVSVACGDTAWLCGEGQTGAPAGATVYGAGIGINLNQALDATGKSTIAVPAAATGISYAIAGSIPATGLTLIIDGGATDYCAPLPTLPSGTVAWSSFSTCLAPHTALAGPPDAASHIQFQVNAGSSAQTFDFCVTALDFACTLAPNTCAVGDTCVPYTPAGGATLTGCGAPGPGAADTLCAGNLDCGAGLGCDTYGSGSLCKAWCQLGPTATACSSGNSCTAFSPPGVVIAGVTYGFCPTGCYLAPNTCGAGETCLLETAASGAVVGDCRVPGTGAVGSSCTFDSDCGAGSGCVTSGGISQCKQWCQLSPTPTTCSARTACTAFAPPGEVVGGVTYGFCP